ncbi:MAG: hypothetical protein ACRCUH_15185 [Shewanella sp.]
MSHTYAAIYKAFRNGASKTHTVAYQSDKPIDSGELLSALIDGIARNAVSSGQANSVNDVSLIGVSLLTPPPQQVPAAVETVDKDELVTAVAELYEALVEVESVASLSDVHSSDLVDTLKSHQAIYDKCKI